MPIEIMEGDLFESDAHVLVNTVNCVGVMGKGIALEFKKRFPEVFEEYAKACSLGQVKPGQVHIVHLKERIGQTQAVINFPTKRHWRDKSLIEDIDSGLYDLVHEVGYSFWHTIAIPALGCNNGGLSWDVVRPKIEAAWAHLPNVRVLLYPPKEVAR